MDRELLSLILWGNLFASIGLTLIALRHNSWRLMAIAAFLSFQFSLLALLSIGPFTILITFLQVATAVAIGRGYSRNGWMLAIGIALATWLLLVGSLILIA